MLLLYNEMCVFLRWGVNISVSSFRSNEPKIWTIYDDVILQILNRTSNEENIYIICLCNCIVHVEYGSIGVIKNMFILN
ncbi:hypothetical protein HDF25_000157 [Pedobacter cryoconitis]|uniref:Uncharacterized protein n=1 Tax=Pedobacter cryoconitis TaxID=188932 RepID=A0A7X0MI32_9SPHI|nr:hypothetical protein [Pedobacter cryoconitis]